MSKELSESDKSFTKKFFGKNNMEVEGTSSDPEESQESQESQQEQAPKEVQRPPEETTESAAEEGELEAAEDFESEQEDVIEPEYEEDPDYEEWEEEDPENYGEDDWDYEADEFGDEFIGEYVAPNPLQEEDEFEDPEEQEGFVSEWLRGKVNLALDDFAVESENRPQIKDAVYSAVMSGELGDGRPSEETEQDIVDLVQQLAQQTAEEPDDDGEVLERAVDLVLKGKDEEALDLYMEEFLESIEEEISSELDEKEDLSDGEE